MTIDELLAEQNAQLKEENERLKLLLGEAAGLINGSGPLSHRIRVYKSEMSDHLSRAREEAANWKALLMATVDEDDGAETWSHAEWADWLSDLTHAYSQQCALNRSDREMVEAKERTERYKAALARAVAAIKEESYNLSKDAYYSVPGYGTPYQILTRRADALRAPLNDPEGVQAAQEWTVMEKIITEARAFISCPAMESVVRALTMQSALAELDALRAGKETGRSETPL